MSAAHGTTGKKECPTCGFTWVRTAQNADKKECPKCNKPLPASVIYGGAATASSSSSSLASITAAAAATTTAGASAHAPGTMGLARPMGDKAPNLPSASSAMESTGGSCPKGGAHTYKFGMCTKCKASEGRILKAPGAVANPGGAGGCPKGGKHMYKFSKCTKCGESEI